MFRKSCVPLPAERRGEMLRVNAGVLYYIGKDLPTSARRDNLQQIHTFSAPDMVQFIQRLAAVFRHFGRRNIFRPDSRFCLAFLSDMLYN